MKRIQFSKGIIWFAGIIFAITLLHCFYTTPDVSMGATELTVTGSMLLSTIVWYYKKASMENVAKIRLDHAKQIADIEYQYFEKRARLSKELSLDEAETYVIQNDSILDEMKNEALQADGNYLNQQFEENASNPEIENL